MHRNQYKVGTLKRLFKIKLFLNVLNISLNFIFLQTWFQLIFVIHLLADQMPNAITGNAHVYPITEVIPIWDVDLNARSVQIVKRIKYVLKRSVSIRVLTRVVRMLFVKSLITCLCAVALQDLLETLLLLAMLFKVYIKAHCSF